MSTSTETAASTNDLTIGWYRVEILGGAFYVFTHSLSHSLSHITADGKYTLKDSAEVYGNDDDYFIYHGSRLELFPQLSLFMKGFTEDTKPAFEGHLKGQSQKDRARNFPEWPHRHVNSEALLEALPRVDALVADLYIDMIFSLDVDDPKNYLDMLFLNSG